MTSTQRMLARDHGSPASHDAASSNGAHERTLEPLCWLLQYPLLRASDLAIIQGLSVSATAARLAHARADGLARTLPASLLGRRVAVLYALSPAGLTYLAERHGPVVWDQARRSQADVEGLLRLIPQLPALLITQSFTFALIAYARESLRIEQSQQVMWAWTRNVRLRTLHDADGTSETDRLMLRCDAVVRLTIAQATDALAHQRVGTSPPEMRTVWTHFQFVILWDSGVSLAYEIRRQLRLLLRIRESYERRGRLTAFPTLLVLAPDDHRAQLWQATALRLATERWLTHPIRGGALAMNEASWRTTSAQSESDDRVVPFPPTVMDAVNPWQADWRSFAQPQSQLLKDLLVAGAAFSHSVGRASSTPPERAPYAPQQGLISTARSDADMRLARLMLRLDARSLRLLTLLYLHPLLSTGQLAATLGVRLPSAERMLRRVRRLNLIQAQTWNGATRPALSELGVQMLARCARLPGGAWATRTNGDPPRVLQRYQREVRSLARVPEHTEGVYSFFTMLLQVCRTKRVRGHDAALLWWETGSICARAFHEHDGWHAVRPDGAGECRVEGQRFRFWLEWDRGTMGPRDLRAKFAAYARYARSHEWRADGNMPLPALLVVTTSEEQVASIEQALGDTVPANLAFNVYITASGALLAQGPLAPIWRPWHVAEPVRAATPRRLMNHRLRANAIDIHAV